MIALSAGLSVDNLIAGFGLGLRQNSPLLLAVTIAVFALLIAWLGIQPGGQARRHWERWAEVGAAGVLSGLAGALGVGWL